MLRAVGTVLRGSLLAQVIGFAVLPLLTRLYAPADFGALQLYQSILAILLAFATMRYEIAILQARSLHELKSLLVLCFTISFGVGLVLALAAGALTWFAPTFLAARLPFAIWLLPLSFFISGVAQFLSFLLTREHAFTLGANSKIAQSTGYCSVGLMAGFTAPGPWGMIAGDIFGKLMSLAFIFPWVRRNVATASEPVRVSDIWTAAKLYRELPLIAMPGTLINSVGGMLSPIMIYATFNAATSGQYGLMDRSLTLPLALIVAAVSQVFSAQIAKGIRDSAENARAIFHRYVMLLFVAGLLPIIALTAFAPLLFSVLFGPDWVTAGSFAQIMAPAYLMMFVAGGTNMALTLLGMQKTQMIWEVGRLIAMILLWTAAQRFNWSAANVVMGHAIVVAGSSVAFLFLTELGLRRSLIPKDFNRTPPVDMS